MPLPFGLQLKVSKGDQVQVNPGTYTGKLIDCEQRQGKFGQFLIIKFEITDSSNNTVTINYLASQKLTLGTPNRQPSKLYQLITTVLARPLGENEEIEFSQLLGKSCRLMIENSTKGYSEIIKVLPIEQGSAL